MAEDQESNGRPRAEVYRPRADEPIWYEPERDEISLVHYMIVLLKHRWKILGLPFLFAVMVVCAAVLWPEGYTSEAVIMPQTGGGMGGQIAQLSGVASQFGINVPSGEPGQSPQFYADLLTSRRLVEEAVTSRYRRGDDPTSGGVHSPEGGASDVDSAGSTLVQLYGIEEDSWPKAVTRATRRLREAISVSASRETGVVELSVTTPWPRVSREVADRLIDLVNRFNNRARQSQASAEAEFVRERLAEAGEDLRAAEDSLETFLQSNVSWQQSPELRFQHDRLQRRLNLQQQVYTSLATRYEEARISEVKNTPVVTTVTEPQIPAEPDSSRLPLRGALGLFVGGILGLFWAFGAEFAESIREEDDEEYRNLLAQREAAAEEVRQAGRRLKRLMGDISSESGS